MREIGSPSIHRVRYRAKNPDSELLAMSAVIITFSKDLHVHIFRRRRLTEPPALERRISALWSLGLYKRGRSGRSSGTPQISESKEWVSHSATQVSPERAPRLKITDNPFPATAILSILLLVAFTTRVDAIQLWNCAANLQNQYSAEWNATHGPTEPPPPFTLTYDQCLVKCGTGLGDINWGVFSQTFSAWLLPWIALMFQIPFGAEGELCMLFDS
jgi:hypothetical protein